MSAELASALYAMSVTVSAVRSVAGRPPGSAARSPRASLSSLGRCFGERRVRRLCSFRETYQQFQYRGEGCTGYAYNGCRAIAQLIY